MLLLPSSPLLSASSLGDLRTYAAMETLTEPHTLTATLSCMIGMARSLVSPDNRYPEGRAHVLPLLMGSLPGVDPNDFSKCMVGSWNSRVLEVEGIPLDSSCIDSLHPSTETGRLRKSCFLFPVSVQITFQFITTFTTLVPIVDCSSAPSHHADLTEVCINYWK